MAEYGLPNSKLEFVQQINYEQIVIVETKITKLGQEGILE